MKNIFLLMILFLVMCSWITELNINYTSPQEKLEILVNGEIFDPEKKTLDYDDIIEFRVTNGEYGAEYKFNEIKLKWLVKKKIAGMNYEVEKKKYIDENSEIQDDIRRKYKLPHDLIECENMGYQIFSKQGSVKIPYSQFAFLPCFSRVVFHLKSIVKVKNQQTYTIKPKDMNLSTKHKDDGISFFPNWDTCRH